MPAPGSVLAVSAGLRDLAAAELLLADVVALLRSEAGPDVVRAGYTHRIPLDEPQFPVTVELADGAKEATALVRLGAAVADTVGGRCAVRVSFPGGGGLCRGRTDLDFTVAAVKELKARSGGRAVVFPGCERLGRKIRAEEVPRVSAIERLRPSDGHH